MYQEALYLVYAGIGLLIISILMQVFRTKKLRILWQFWAAKDSMTKAELYINRAGLVIALVGMAIRLLNRFGVL